MKFSIKSAVFIAAAIFFIAATVTSFTIIEQTKILSKQNIPPDNIENANMAIVKHGIYAAFLSIILVVLTKILISRISARSGDNLEYLGQYSDLNFSGRESDVIDGLLGSIGSAINSVVIGLSTIRENMTGRKLTSHLNSLADVVKEHQDDFCDYVENDPEGQSVAPFIVALADDFSKNDEELAKTTTRVFAGANFIANIVRKAQLYRRQAAKKYRNI